MLSKTLAIVAEAARDLLGGRADRERFDQIKEQAARVWHDPAESEFPFRDRRRSRA